MDEALVVWDQGAAGGGVHRGVANIPHAGLQPCARSIVPEQLCAHARFAQEHVHLDKLPQLVRVHVLVVGEHDVHRTRQLAEPLSVYGFKEQARRAVATRASVLGQVQHRGPGQDPGAQQHHVHRNIGARAHAPLAASQHHIQHPAARRLVLQLLEAVPRPDVAMRAKVDVGVLPPCALHHKRLQRALVPVLVAAADVISHGGAIEVMSCANAICCSHVPVVKPVPVAGGHQLCAHAQQPRAHKGRKPLPLAHPRHLLLLLLPCRRRSRRHAKFESLGPVNNHSIHSVDPLDGWFRHHFSVECTTSTQWCQLRLCCHCLVLAST